MFTFLAVGLLLAAAAADLYFTKRVLDGGSQDVGFLLGPVAERHGFAGIVAVKGLLTAVLTLIAFAMDWFGAAVALAGAATWAVFAVHNMRQL